MRLLISRGFCLALVLCLIEVLPFSSAAQSAPSNAVPRRAGLGPIRAIPDPPLPTLKSPVDFFRELLAKSPAERKQFLADRTPEARKQILAKVREYESLRPNVREWRLRATELRWYLWPLMNSPATNRLSQLSQIPLEDRALVEVRLREWDKLPPTVQKELLDNEVTLRFFTEVEGSTEDQKRQMLESISPQRRAKLEAGISRWRSMPEDQRQKLVSRFNRFFDLTDEEKQKTLNSLSEPERQQLEKTLRAYSNLPPQQRAQCVRSFEKFANLSLAERQQFLKNAERWKLMSPDERQAWRELIAKLPPPMPEELPPSPLGGPNRSWSRPTAVSTVATNGR